MDAWPVTGSLVGIGTSVRRIRSDVFRGTEQALQALEARRAQVVATLQEQMVRLMGGVLGRMNVASRADIGDLHVRLGALERRIHKLASKDASGTRRAVGG
jgi:polyhydroxyalkanoate synthesis regulator phasin